MNRIKQLRQETGMSQKDLANEIGVSQPTISAWENGQVEPDRTMQTHLCYIFKCSSDYLAGIAPEALAYQRGWSAEKDAAARKFLSENVPHFVSTEEQQAALRDAAEQEWLRGQADDEDLEQKAIAKEAYLEDLQKRTGMLIESVEINAMMEKLSSEERQQLVRVARAMFPAAIVG